MVCLAIVSWGAALFFFGAGISPGVGEPTETESSIRVTFMVLGALLVVLPLLVIALPAHRRVLAVLDPVLGVAAQHPRPELPAFDSWGGPERMFTRLRWSCYSYTAIPLLLLVGSAVAFGGFLGEPVAAAVFGGLALVPALFGYATVTLPARLRRSVRRGLAAGQVVPVRIASRIDRKATLSDASQSWFDATLPDGQHVTLRTPVHFPWAADARGVVDAPDLVLVVGSGGHQGLLLAPGRPEDAVWLLGPVPLARSPRSVQRAFAGSV